MTSTHLPGTKPVTSWQYVELHPLFIRRLNTDQYAIFRVDGGAVIHTRSLGVETVRLLRQVNSVRGVQSILESVHQTHFDLSPLLEALAHARLVRSVDGVVVNAERLNPVRVVRCGWRCWVDWTIRAPAWVSRILPLSLALPLIRVTSRRRIARSEYARGLDALPAALPTSMGARDPHALAASHVREVAHSDALARMLCASDPVPLSRWFRQHVRLEGVHHLRDAMATGGGVLVAALHAGAFPLLMPSITSAGIPFHSFNFGVQFAGRPIHQILDLLSDSVGWARAHFYYEATQRNLGSFVRSLRSGGVGIVMPDYFSPEGGRSTGRRTEVEVAFGERRLLVHDFAGWLVRTTGAAVVPCEAVYEGRGRYYVRFTAPIPAARFASTDKGGGEVTRFIFELLVESLLDKPERWNFLGRYKVAPVGAPRPAAA